eukprot:5937013-Amphidinium_carterae.1
MKAVSRIAQPLHGIDALQEVLAKQSSSLYFPDTISESSTRPTRVQGMVQIVCSLRTNGSSWDVTGVYRAGLFNGFVGVFLAPMLGGSVPLRTRVGKVVSHGNSRLCRAEQWTDTDANSSA